MLGRRGAKDSQAVLVDEADTPLRINEPDVTSRLQQQTLAAWFPIRSNQCVVYTFVVTALLFIALGVCIIIVANRSVIEYSVRYDNLSPVCPSCHHIINFTISTEMKPPIFFYYRLSGYYQNHRTYAQSRSDLQLAGYKSYHSSSCAPMSKWNRAVLYPCGLIAQSFFNDTFTDPVLKLSVIKTVPLQNENWDKKGITWESDIKGKYKTRALAADETWGPNNPEHRGPADPEMAVWLRIAAMPTFKKLHRRILNMTLPAGSELYVNVLNRYPTANGSFEKEAVIATTSPLGGSQLFLAWTFIFVGVLLMVLSLLIICIAYTQLDDNDKYFAIRVHTAPR